MELEYNDNDDGKRENTHRRLRVHSRRIAQRKIIMILQGAHDDASSRLSG